MNQDEDFLAARFEDNRAKLTSVAYRMLGSLTEAEDAVQEAWLRLARSDARDIENLGGWLTTVVGRVCLDMLRVRTRRAEQSLEARLPDPVLSAGDAVDPEQEVLMADAVGLALQVVLESLSPAERLAFVLHDLFGLPFEQIAPIVDRTPVTAKKLASRARRRVRGAAPGPDTDLAGQRRVVDAFQEAVRGDGFEALLAVLDPDVVLRVDGGSRTGGLRILHGAQTVARQAFRNREGVVPVTHRVLVNGAAGLVNTVGGVPVSVLGFTVAGDRITAIDLLLDPVRLAALDRVTFTGERSS